MDTDPRHAASAGAPSWAAAFDPAANVRALTELQRRGLEAAQLLTERLATAMDGATVAPPEGDAASPLDGLIDLWAELAKGIARGLSTQADGWRSRPDGGPRVIVQRDGQGGTTEIWLHNEGQTDRHDLRPHCGELRATDGTLLEADVTFEPPLIERLPGRSSQGVTLRVHGVADSAPTGTSRGVVLVDGLEDACLVLEVIVVP